MMSHPLIPARNGQRDITQGGVVDQEMTRLILILLISIFVSLTMACNRASDPPLLQVATGGWRIIDQDESQSGDNEFQVYATAEVYANAKNPPDEVSFRFKLPGEVRRGFSSKGGFTIIFKDVDASYHFEFRELLDRKDQFRHDQLLNLEQFRIKKGQQGVEPQSATCSESKSEGSDKLQPEAEGHSR